MLKWKEIKKDGMPKDDGMFLVKHEEYFYNPIQAIYNGTDFLLYHGGSIPTCFPSQIPLVVTHWLEIPE